MKSVRILATYLLGTVILANSPLWAQGTAGYALRFGVNSGFVNIADAFFDGGSTSEFTVECWIRTSNQSMPYNAPIYIKWANWNEIDFTYLNGQLAFGYIHPSQTYHYVVDGSLTSSEWHHVAATMANSVMRLFSDGILVGEISTNGDINWWHSEGQRIGRSIPGPYDRVFDGDIDEMRVSSIARYTTSFPVPTAPFANDQFTEALYHFDEGTGSVLHDASGHGHDGTLIDNPLWIPSDIFTPPCPPTSLPFVDNFDSPELDSCWTWIREDPSHWSLTERPGWMRITTQEGDYSDLNTVNLLCRVAPTGDFRLELKVAIQSFVSHQSAGPIVRVDGQNYLSLVRSTGFGTETPALSFTCASNGVLVLNQHLVVMYSDTLVWFRIDFRGGTASGYWSRDSLTWQYLSSVAPGWLTSPGTKIGVSALNGNGIIAPEIPADFDYFRVDPIRSIQITQPNGGEQWRVFQHDTVRWQSTACDGPVRIELNRAYPEGAWETLADSTENDGLHQVWVTDPLSSRCRIRILALQDPVSDMSDADFAIIASQGYLALVLQSQPAVPVITWNAGIRECPQGTSATYRLKNFGSENVVVFTPALTGTPHFSLTHNCPPFFALAPGQMSSYAITLNYAPQSEGIHRDTLRMQSDAVNAVGGLVRIPLSGEQIRTPATPQVVIQAVGQDARLAWSPITSSAGGCAITVTGYLIFYSPTVGGPYYYHGYTADTSYVHTRVVRYNFGMFYQVVASRESPALLMQLPTGEHSRMSESEVYDYLRIHREER